MNEQQIFEYLKNHLSIRTYMWHMSGILGIQLVLNDPNGEKVVISEKREHIRL